MRSRTEFAAALILQIIGAGTVLLVSVRPWQTITTLRSRPFRADVLAVIGRTVDAAPTALALVGLAGVVAVLATKGTVRRGVGALVAASGVAAAYRSVTAMRELSPARAAAIVRDKHPLVADTSVVARHVVTHPVWGVLSAVAALALFVAGLLVAVRGERWQAMSARYEAPVAGSPTAGRHPVDPDDAERAETRARIALWTALEHGHDPTADDPSDSH